MVDKRWSEARAKIKEYIENKLNIQLNIQSHIMRSRNCADHQIYNIRYDDSFFIKFNHREITVRISYLEFKEFTDQIITSVNRMSNCTFYRFLQMLEFSDEEIEILYEEIKIVSNINFWKITGGV